MSRLSFNKTPYYDDFQANKNYMKILFRPGRPVQTREMNQIQSIFQNQLEKFANHIFKNGSRVSNATATFMTKSYVRLNELSPWDNQSVDVNYLNEGTMLLGKSSGITAVVVKSVPEENDDPPTLFIVYLGVGIDGETFNFLPGEIIDVFDSNGINIYSVKVRCPGCAGSILEETIPVTGTGNLFVIDEGIFYFEGLFIENSRQLIIVSKYGVGSFDCKIGFDFVQEIITSDKDQSILDNVLGYPNSTAPGADRYKASLILTKRSLDLEDGDDFILLAKLERGQYTNLKVDSDYSDIMDMIAKRTYETNGNFTVVPFKLRFMEEKAESIEDDLGYSIDGDPDYIRAVVSGGISYVQGYRFENQGEQFIRGFKARDTVKSSSFIKRFEERTSINLIPLKGYSLYPNKASQSPVIDTTVINIWDGPFDGGKNPTGTIIGTFRIYDVNYLRGIIHDEVTPAVYKYYIFDLNMSAGKKISEAQSFADSSGTTGFKAVPEDINVTLYNPGKTELLWKLQRENIETLRSISDQGNTNPPGSIQIYLRKKLIGFLNSSGSVTFNSATNEFFEEFDPLRTVAVIIDTDQGAGIARSIDITGKTSISTTEFTLDLDDTVDIGTGTPLNTTGKMVCIVHSVMRVNARENAKGYNFVQNDNFIPGSMVNNFINLGIADAHSVDYVIAFDQTQLNDPGTDITSQFILESRTNESTYDESQLFFTGTLPSNVDIRWKYRVNYLEHDLSSHLGYFNIDSYRDLIADEYINYEDNPIYISSNKTEYPLLASFDFRPIKLGTDIESDTVPVIGSTAVFDISYYLGRTDLLCINKSGFLYIKKGVSSDKPVPPKVDNDAMALYEIYFKPYTYSMKDISVKYIENKRYTMRDIGKIESRIKLIEYYTALSLLEKNALDMNIKDINGLDRFKNGFVADNFQNYQAADLKSSDFRAAVDRTRKELRPSFTPRNKNLLVVPDESECIFLGSMAMIDFDKVLIDQQPFATKHISINPYFQYKKKGEMILFPNMDVWADTTRLPELTINIDTGVEELRELATANGLLGTHWGSWADLNTTVQNATVTTVAPLDPWGGTSTTNTTVTTSTTQQQRSGNDVTMGSRTTSYDLGDRVTDVSLNPWMRATEINFIATKMTSNAKVYAFFDNKPVSQFTRLLKGIPGEQLITDSSGQIAGVFNCPPGMFHTGDRKFYLTSDKDLTGDPDLEFTSAESVFFSGGLNVVKQHTTQNVITPTFDVQQISGTRTVVDTATNSNTVNIPGAPPPPPPLTCDDGRIDTAHGAPMPCMEPDGMGGCHQRCTCCEFCSGCFDPVAQGFKIPHDCFITGIDIYFQEVSSILTEEVFFQIRTMSNGYPTKTTLGEKRFLVSDIKPFISNDSKTAFHVDFDFPIFVEGDVSYCFVVGGYSPTTRIWVSKLGMPIVDNPSKIVEVQPSLESSFRSQNGETWNAEQFEDIKYNLYAAQFKNSSMSIKFNNGFETTELLRDPFESEEDSSKIRVYVEDHGLLPGDKVTINLYKDNWFWVDVTSGEINIGMTIRNLTNTFSGEIQNYKIENGKKYIQIKKMKGSFVADEVFICDQMDKLIHSTYLVSKLGYTGDKIQNNGMVRFNIVNGIFREGCPEFAIFNGFYFSDLCKQHIVTEVDSMDTFIIQIGAGLAIESGRFGGEAATININEKFEIFNVSGAYLPYGSSEVWKYEGVGHNPINGPFDSQNYQKMLSKDITIGDDMFLDVPHKITSEDNANDASKLVSIEAIFTSPNQWISPIINTDSFSITTVSNRVEWVTSNQLNVEPNSTGRFKNESDPMNGTENYKYVTKTINLANPATDLVIAYDVYKDINSDYDIWIKVVAPYETTDIDTKRWMRIVGIDKTYHSLDLMDRIEYEITASNMQLEVYTNDIDFTIEEWEDVVTDFKSYKIKIVGKSKNPALPPLFQSFRAIAVT